MKWVYILHCEDDYFYVGETSRLYRRFWEHKKGLGGLNTSVYSPKNIVAIYPANRLGKFFDYSQKVSNHDYGRDGIMENFNVDDENEYEYDSLWVENNITEKMMIDHVADWKKIRGGKYVRFDAHYTFPENPLVKELPNCHCGYPCDVKQNEEDSYLFFRCAKKNMWDKMREEFDIYDEPCNFFLKYTKDTQYKVEKEIKIQKVKALTNKSYWWLKELAGDYYEHCIGGCGKEFDRNNTVRVSRRALNLCFDCFINKHDELSKKYTGKCQLEL